MYLYSLTSQYYWDASLFFASIFIPFRGQNCLFSSILLFFFFWIAVEVFLFFTFVNVVIKSSVSLSIYRYIIAVYNYRYYPFVEKLLYIVYTIIKQILGAGLKVEMG